MSLKLDSAPGPDGIRIDLIANCLGLLSSPLLTILNACLKLKYVPVEWRKARVRVIRKQNKRNYSDRKSYRPISVINATGKILEAILLRRLSTVASENNWISHRQHGFVPKRSTETAAHRLCEIVESNFKAKKITATAFIDISAAFDTAWPTAILASLIKKNCPSYLVHLISSYLSGRCALLKDDQDSFSWNVSIGCPQGGVISPFLWNILIDDILRADFAFDYEIIAYADDLVLISVHPDAAVAVQNLQLMCKSIVERLGQILLEVNASKTGFMIFRRNRNSLPDLRLVVNNVEIYPTDRTVYLGFTLDPGLRWRAHIESKCVSTKRIIHGLRRYMRLTWGLDTLNLRLLYNSKVLPTLLYGCSVWARVITTRWCRQKLLSVQRFITKQIARAFKSVSNNALLILSCVLPIDLKVLDLTARRYLALKGTSFSLSAMEAIKEVSLHASPETNPGVSTDSENKRKVSKTLWNLWSSRWESGTDSSLTREFFPTANHALFLRRAYIHHELTQVVTGHSMLNTHLFKTGRVQSPRCACGVAEETTQHFLFDCPRYSLERAPLRQSISDAKISFPPPLHVFAECPTLFRVLMNYVKKTNRLSLLEANFV